MQVNDRTLMLQGTIFEATPSRRSVLTDIRKGVRVKSVRSFTGRLDPDETLSFNDVSFVYILTTGKLNIVFNDIEESAISVEGVFFSDMSANAISLVNKETFPVECDIRIGVPS